MACLVQHVGAVRYLLYRQQLALREADEVGLRLGRLQMHTPPYYREYVEYPLHRELIRWSSAHTPTRRWPGSTASGAMHGGTAGYTTYTRAHTHTHTHTHTNTH